MRFIILLLVSLASTAIGFCQNEDTLYQKKWKEIDSLIFKKDLSRSALDKVNLVYNDALKHEQPIQQIKALLYKINLEERLNEADINKNIKQLIQESEASKDITVKSIVYSLVAQKYKNNYERNRGQLYNRSKTINYKKDDIASWSVDDFHAAITYWFNQSLKASAALKKVNIAKLESILTNNNTTVLRPTLYDLLAHRALDYFKSDETYITKPAYAFVIDDYAALDNIEGFTNHTFITKDTVSNKWKALLLFQQLISFHNQRKDTAALIDVDVERLQFARSNGVMPGKDSLYYNALNQTAQRFKQSKYAAQAWFLLAQWHADKAAMFNPLRDTANRWEYVKALDIAKQFLPLTDSTEGSYNLYNLYNSITAKNISLQTEEVNVPGLPFRSLVNYKHVEKIYYRIIPATKAVEDTIEAINQRLGWNAYINAASSFAFILQQQVALPAQSDYQTHSVEIKLDALPVGKYYMLTSSSPQFSANDKLALSNFYVSNISFINNGEHYFILDRTTGEPLANAKVQVWEDNGNYKRGQPQKVKQESYTTDNNGYFKLKIRASNSRNILLDITHGNDKLFLNHQQYAYANRYRHEDDNDDDEDDKAYEEDKARAYFFTDRSIYRPSQIVYFKMLVLTKDRQTGKQKIYTTAKDNDYVFLKDVNGKKVDSLLIKLNDYGSFAGSFKLPQNTLTGNFSLQTSTLEEAGGGQFSVEEYKRPTFYVQLEKPKGTYKLNDTLTVTGVAKSYAGNTIDGASIKYSVKRKGRFLYPWLWYRGSRPGSAEISITFGEALTDAAGKFTIKFAALPDVSVAKEMLPVFDYVVDADVTDIAGETRSSSTIISAGYHSLNIKITAKETAEADSVKSISVRTTNIAGDKEPATVKVQIYSLQQPQQLIRRRYWNEPDQFIYNKEEYKQYFPHDEYSNESDKAHWPKGEVVFQSTINTTATEKVDLSSVKFSSGWYVTEAVTTDKDGHEIKDLQYMQLYSTKDGAYKSGSYLFSAINVNAVTPGEPASFLIGSAAKNIHLIQLDQHKPEGKSDVMQSNFTFLKLDESVKKILVTPTSKDIGGMGVAFAFVKDNRTYIYNQTVLVKEEANDLHVQVETYRNKLEPGNKEQWTVKISGKNNEAVAAEVLTSMYDASLDQFKQHAWQLPAFTTPQFYASGWNNIGFSQVRSTVNNLQIPLKYFFKRYADLDLNLSKTYNDRRVISQSGGYDFDMNIESALHGRLPGVDISASLQEAVVVGYGTKKELTAATTALSIRGNSTAPLGYPLYIVDGKIVSSVDDISSNDIIDMQVVKDAATTAMYGARAANGVVLITTKNGAAKKAEEPLHVRTNFNETAFFFPQLTTDKDGCLSFTFTLPEALTEWKWQIFAHNKEANFGLTQRTIVSQKTLMVQLNAPRFLREGDKMELSAKVSNLSESKLSGQATLQLIDAITLQPVNNIFANSSATKNFNAEANQSTGISFGISVPFNYNKPVTWRIVAKAATFSDGEENTLPVLTNRMLVTESLPLFIKNDSSKKFTFTKLKEQQSRTLQHHAVTVEYTSNPVWYALQSLPYLVEYPYECSEQTFNRYFANALAAKIISNNPKIKQVFDRWKKDTASLKSNLQKNEELKSILLQETPWVLQAENEEQQKRSLAFLFDAMKMNNAFKTNIEKLKQMQLSSGGFTWFKGGNEDRYITQYIVTGIGRLKEMNALPDEDNDIMNMANKALSYLDNEIINDYKDLQKYKVDLTKNNIGPLQIQYLYMRRFFNNDLSSSNKNTAYKYFYQQAKQYWVKQSYYFKAMIGEELYRNNDKKFVMENILPSIFENAITSEDAGMYWKENEHSYHWYHAPVEQQALMIEFVNEIYQHEKTNNLQQKIDEMKTWLLIKKQTNNWSTTKATADACYALLLNGSNWLNTEKEVTIQLGNYIINSKEQVSEAGTGYIKQTIAADKVVPQMGNISVMFKKDKAVASSPSWGAVHWQYFEDLDKITSSSTPLSINKKLFIERNTERGKELSPIKDGDKITVGDKVKIIIEIRVDRSMEYVHLKDMRASSMEPVNVLSSYKWQDGLGYYESTKDASTNFFISYLPKGTYVFEYPVNITLAGNYSVGIASAQCMYAPEFNSHSEGIRMNVIAREASK